MKTELKDVLYLYVGCDVLILGSDKAKLLYIEDFGQYGIIVDLHNGSGRGYTNINNIKPIHAHYPQ